MSPSPGREKEPETPTSLSVRSIRTRSCRCSSDPALESSPAWSPDGTTIAFLRRLGDRRSALVVISALGGRERVLAEVETPATSGISWSRDGASIAVIERLGDGLQRRSHFRRIPVEGGAEQEVRFSLASFRNANYPTFSPDGSSLAFLAAGGSWEGSVHVAELAGDSVRLAANLDGQRDRSGSNAQDGSELIVGRYTPLRVQSLLRVRLRDDAVSEVTVGGYPTQPSLSADGSRLVYSEQSSRFDISRFRIKGEEGGVDRFIASTRFDGNPQYSADGQRVAFSSARSGQIDIWIADADGSNPLQAHDTRRLRQPPLVTGRRPNSVRFRLRRQRGHLHRLGGQRTPRAGNAIGGL